MLTIKEIASLLGITRSTLYRWIGRGIAVPIRPMPNGRKGCPRPALLAWMAENGLEPVQ